VNILIIEKSIDVNRSLSKDIKMAFAKTVTVTSYKDALSKIGESVESFDAIITEYDLGNGIDVRRLSQYLSTIYNEAQSPTLLIYSPQSYDYLLEVTRECKYPKVNFLSKPNLSLLTKMIESVWTVNKYSSHHLLSIHNNDINTMTIHS
jgi:DNA-binding NtrC family response regulator